MRVVIAICDDYLYIAELDVGEISERLLLILQGDCDSVNRAVLGYVVDIRFLAGCHPFNNVVGFHDEPAMRYAEYPNGFCAIRCAVALPTAAEMCLG